MGNQRMSRHGFRRAAVIAVLGGVAAACSSIPDAPAPVFMKGGTPGIADAARGPAMSSSRPSAMGPRSMAALPRQERQMPDRQIPDRQITVERGQSLGKLAVQYHVSKQAIIAANHLEPPDYKVKIGSRLTIPGAGAPVQQAMAPPPASAGPSRDVIPLDDPPSPRTAAAPPTRSEPVGPPPRAAAPAPSSSPPASVAVLPPPAPPQSAPPPAPPQSAPPPRPAPMALPAPHPAPIP